MKLTALPGPWFSFEFFPPKTAEGEAQLFDTLRVLQPLNPSFVSITYGAGGSTQQKTLEWARQIRSMGLEVLIHLTCASLSRTQILELLTQLNHEGFENLLALRGDPPRGQAQFVPTADGFAHANDLVAFIRDRFDRAFALGGAAYPESHPEASSAVADLEHFRRKVEAGLDFAITQLFFNNAHYLGFVERVRRAGLELPIIAGLMPVTNLAQIRRFITLCGASFPGPLLTQLEEASSPEEVLRQGVAHTARQAAELLASGAPGLHFYTLNKSPATRQILAHLRSQ